jgi:hypothetical protein
VAYLLLARLGLEPPARRRRRRDQSGAHAAA